MPTNAYFQDKRISASQLKLFSGRDYCPEVARHKLANPPAPSAAMNLGSALHSLLENNGKLSCEFAVNTFDGRTKAGKEFRASNGDRIIISAPEYDQALAMMRAVDEKTATPLRQMLHHPKALQEQAYFTESEKCCCDVVFEDLVIDYKTTQATSLNQWLRDAVKYGYHLQVAHYLDVTGLDDFYFVVVSSVEPYPVFTVKASPDFIAMGRESKALALHRMNEAVHEPKIEMANAPPWWTPGEAQEEEDFPW